MRKLSRETTTNVLVLLQSWLLQKLQKQRQQQQQL